VATCLAAQPESWHDISESQRVTATLAPLPAS
jgi:hypothetical protein